MRAKDLWRDKRGGSMVLVGFATVPIVAFVAGRFMDEMPGMSFGHAGTVVNKKVDSPADKMRRMREAGISVAEEIGDIPDLVRERLGN